MFRQMFDPDPYHGRIPWNKFEGWYFKVCAEGSVFSFIPGIFHGDPGADPHSFLQVLNGNSTTYDYVRFPAGSFKASRRKLEISVGENSFSLAGANVRTQTVSGRLEADLRFGNIIRWDNRALLHRSMGSYNFLPFMECYAQVCVMDMDVSGTVSLDGKRHELRNGRGYIEKNWGSHFPISWLWVQCNSFEKARASLSVSVGHIPFVLGSFRGFLTGLDTGTGFYRFTSMNGSSLLEKPLGRDRTIVCENKKYRLEIAAQTSEDAFVLCNAPKDGRMVPLVRETLTADVHVKLTDKSAGRTLFEDEGHMAGIEYGGKPL